MKLTKKALCFGSTLIVVLLLSEKGNSQSFEPFGAEGQLEDSASNAVSILDLLQGGHHEDSESSSEDVLSSQRTKRRCSDHNGCHRSREFCSCHQHCHSRFGQPHCNSRKRRMYVFEEDQGMDNTPLPFRLGRHTREKRCSYHSDCNRNRHNHLYRCSCHGYCELNCN